MRGILSHRSVIATGLTPVQGKGGTQRVASWWGEPHIPWSSYRIERVPPGCKPLLVFMNTKSGPQLGSRLRRRLLRLLNPIQVHLYTKVSKPCFHPAWYLCSLERSDNVCYAIGIANRIIYAQEWIICE